jgi:uncharacterized membrane protein|nr:hypothetical protein [Candidatus Cloacimonadota bacterium]
MNVIEIKAEARRLMSEQMGTLIITFVIYDLIFYITGSLFAIGAILVYGPLSYGAANILLKVLNSEKVEISMLFSGFDDFADTLSAGLLIMLYVFLWSLLFIIPGIIAAFSYSMTFYIMRENPEMSPSQAMAASKHMMYGHKWQLFDLYFSFLGWILLCIISFGIASIYVTPYMSVSTAVFYADLKQNYTYPIF